MKCRIILALATTFILTFAGAQEISVPRDAFFWVSGTKAYTAKPLGGLTSIDLETFDSIELEVDDFEENGGRALAATDLGRRGFLVFGDFIDTDGVLASGLLLLDPNGNSLRRRHVTAKGFRQGQSFYSMVGLSNELVAAFWIGDDNGEFVSGASILRVKRDQLSFVRALLEPAPIRYDGFDLQARRDTSLVQVVDGYIYVFDAVAGRIARFNMDGSARRDLSLERLPQDKILLGGNPGADGFFLTYITSLEDPEKVAALLRWDGCVTWIGPVERPRLFPIGDGKIVTRFGTDVMVGQLSLPPIEEDPCE